MRKATILMHGVEAAVLTEVQLGKNYNLTYLAHYAGPPVSLTFPLRASVFEFNEFPAFFDGLLPEGIQLESLLREAKIDRQDHFTQLLCVGEDLVGAVTVQELTVEGAP